jgi:hypothetical protein
VTSGAWHECEWPFVTEDGRVFFQPTCNGTFECEECGELVGWCCGGAEAWTDPSKPDPGAICNECWCEHYGEEAAE